MRKKSKVVKGQHNYIDIRKMAQLKKTILLFLLAAAIFILGLALNKWEKSNVFTIIAALCVLPAAKAMVGYIVLAPYSSVSQEEFERIEPVTKESEFTMCDLVFTSKDKVMNLDFLVVKGHKAIGLCGKKADLRAYMENYLNDGFKTRGYALKAVMCQDEAAFKRAISSTQAAEISKEDVTQWKAYLESLLV